MAQRIRFAAASEHLILRGEYFRKRPLHENDLIVAPFRDRQEKLGNNLHDLAFSFVDAIGLLGKKLGGFPLRVAPWVVGVRLAFEVGEDDHAACTQHLHHQGCPRAGESRDYGDHDSTNTFLRRAVSRQ